DYWRLLVAMGFVGAYTTFSTFEYESLRLITDGGNYASAAINILGSVSAGFVAAYGGVVAARLLCGGR
ncbi:MAG TPA: CrcB family protein, partial [Chthonomonadales bacterium]|nr:CrcB family protein [Chthonomonadales bacterium]